MGAAWLVGAGFLGTQRKDPQSRNSTSGEGVPNVRCYHYSVLKLILGVKKKLKTGTNCCWADANRTSKKTVRSKSLLPLPVF